MVKIIIIITVHVAFLIVFYNLKQTLFHIVFRYPIGIIYIQYIKTQTSNSQNNRYIFITRTQIIRYITMKTEMLYALFSTFPNKVNGDTNITIG